MLVPLPAPLTDDDGVGHAGEEGLSRAGRGRQPRRLRPDGPAPCVPVRGSSRGGANPTDEAAPRRACTRVYGVRCEMEMRLGSMIMTFVAEAM